MWDRTKVNALDQVTSLEAEEMARRLAREEGLFAGTSTGANVTASPRVAEQLGPEGAVVSIAADSVALPERRSLCLRSLQAPDTPAWSG